MVDLHRAERASPSQRRVYRPADHPRLIVAGHRHVQAFPGTTVRLGPAGASGERRHHHIRRPERTMPASCGSWKPSPQSRARSSAKRSRSAAPRTRTGRGMRNRRHPRRKPSTGRRSPASGAIPTTTPERRRWLPPSVGRRASMTRDAVPWSTTASATPVHCMSAWRLSNARPARAGASASGSVHRCTGRSTTPSPTPNPPAGWGASPGRNAPAHAWAMPTASWSSTTSRPRTCSMFATFPKILRSPIGAYSPTDVGVKTKR